jgi:hypothetical protein
MLNTPRGMPACSSSRAIIIAVSGTFSLGLSTNVFPHASATGYIQSGTIAGKLNGVMPTQTPSGWRMVSQSIAARDVLDALAGEQRRHAARELDHLDPAP